jgi:hypothetical protein
MMMVMMMMMMMMMMMTTMKVMEAALSYASSHQNDRSLVVGLLELAADDVVPGLVLELDLHEGGG